jgi:flagellar basal-body rod protein FlgG
MNLGLWAAKTGLDAQNTQMAVIANNLANSNTNGYKADRAAFQDLMYQNVQQVGAQSTQNTQYSTGLSLGTGVRIAATVKNYTQGSVLQTGGNLDMSITGTGFFQVTMPDGTLSYTRDGSFSLDSQGNVVTASGYPISPAITIPISAQSVTIGSDGTVSVTTAGTAKPTTVGQPTGNNLLTESGSSGAPQVGTPGTNGLGSVQQGSLETSNVNTVTEMVNMITCQRAYEMDSKAISTTDQMLQYLTTNLS